MFDENMSRKPGGPLTITDWEIGLHLVQLLNVIIPAAGLISAAAIWKMKGEESEKIKRHGKDVVNFQIAMVILSITVGLFRTIAFYEPFSQAGVTVTSLLNFFAIALQVYFPIIASMRVKEGIEPHYPIVHKFLI